MLFFLGRAMIVLFFTVIFSWAGAEMYARYEDSSHAAHGVSAVVKSKWEYVMVACRTTQTDPPSRGSGRCGEHIRKFIETILEIGMFSLGAIILALLELFVLCFLSRRFFLRVFVDEDLGEDTTGM